MRPILLDLRSTGRQLRSRFGSTVALVLLVAAGTSLPAVMFALADPFLLRPLAYPSPQQIVLLFSKRTDGAGVVSPGPTVRDWRARAELFVSVAPFRPSPSLTRIALANGTYALTSASVDPELLRILGHPEVPCPSQGPARCYVLSDAAWARHFARDRTVLGRTGASGAGAIVLAGVSPVSFVFPWPSPTSRVEAILLDPPERSLDEEVVRVPLIARLREGISPIAVEAALNGGLSGSGLAVRVETLSTYMTKISRPAAAILMGAGALIILVCLASIANLLFARNIYRSTEWTIREAIGASKQDLVRLFALESSGIAAIGLVGALAITVAVLTSLQRWLPAQYGLLGAPTLSFRVTTMAALVAFGMTYVASAIAAAGLAGRSAAAWAGNLRQTNSGVNVRFAMIVTQTALSVLLLTGAIILARSYVNLFSQSTGFDKDAGLIFAVYRPALPGDDVHMEVNRTLGRLRPLPGIVDAGAMTGPPLIADVRIAGCCVSVAGQVLTVAPREVTATFVNAAGTRIVEGRALVETDRNGAGLVVNQTFARTVWPNESALGRNVGLGVGSETRVGMVVGVVEDTLDRRLDQISEPRLYRLFDHPPSGVGCDVQVTYVVRPVADGSLAAARRVVSAGLLNVVVTEANSVGERLSRSVSERVFVTIVSVMLSVVVIFVCVAGLVTVVAFVTYRRTRELAIRSALGASRGHILHVTVLPTMIAVLCGVAAGTLLTRLASALLVGLTYGIDARAWSAAVPGIALVATLAVVAAFATAARAFTIPLGLAVREE